jgi:hypothetical protein
VALAATCFVFAVALFFASHAQAQDQRVAAGHLPTVGVFVPGVSLAGIKLGMTEKQVASILGKNPSLCTAKISDLCREPVYLYEYTHGEPLGVGVKFHSFEGNEKVDAVFMLGTIAGWRTKDGLKIGDPVSNIYSFYTTPLDTNCIGFAALSAKSGTITTSFYTADGIVSGFALTEPPEGICQ